MNKYLKSTLAIFIFSFSFSQSDNLIVDKSYTKDIEKLARNTKVKKAFEYIVDIEEKTNRNLIELTEIEAPPFKEMKRAEEFAERLRLAGLENVWIDSIGNVLGFLKGSIGDKNIALDAHIDTVFPEGTDVKVRVKNDTLFAPGVADDTRGLAMILTIAESIKKQNIEGCLLFNISKQSVNPGKNFGPYGLPKSALLNLCKQYAVDYGSLGIRSNGINADRIRSGLLNDGMIKSRAKAREVSTDEYMRGNLLLNEVKAEDVAKAFFHLAISKKTTGAVLTVDGGNIAASLR